MPRLNNQEKSASALLRLSPNASGLENARALQEAIDHSTAIYIQNPGVYRIATTVFLPSDTYIRFAPGVVLQKSDEKGPFSHVFLNRGALSKTYDQNITIEGLTLEVNKVDHADWTIFGLRGHLAFFYIRDLRIRGFRCLDLDEYQYCIHICNFEDILIEDLVIKGDKDGVHLGHGRRFLIRDCVFQTFDDAIALNSHDYDTGNPELGWIEDGVIQNCHDLAAESTTGFFARLTAGSWIDWQEGMEVRKSDSVISNGRLYRVRGQPDGTTYRSMTAPTHKEGEQILDGISWVMAQTHLTYTAGVRDVVFRDIFLHKSRVSFSIRFDNDRFSRTYYPGSKSPVQQRILFDNVRAFHKETEDFLAISAPIDSLTLSHCVLGKSRIRFLQRSELVDYGPTQLTMLGCKITGASDSELIINEIPNKTVSLDSLATIYLLDETGKTTQPK